MPCMRLFRTRGVLAMGSSGHFIQKTLWLVVILAPMCPICGAAAGERTTNSEQSVELVRKLTARRGQFVSGRIEYHVFMSFKGREESNDAYHYLFSFAGPSWIIRCLPPTGNGVILSHGDKYIKYNE